MVEGRMCRYALGIRMLDGTLAQLPLHHITNTNTTTKSSAHQELMRSPECYPVSHSYFS